MEGFTKWFWSFIGNANFTEAIMYLVSVRNNSPLWDFSTAQRGLRRFKRNDNVLLYSCSYFKNYKSVVILPEFDACTLFKETIQFIMSIFLCIHIAVPKVETSRISCFCRHLSAKFFSRYRRYI